jgi:thioredoxin reductase (NADPH)
MDKSIKDLIIVGGGPAGLTAAIYTARAAIDTTVIAGSPAGGQLLLTTDVENFPGFPQGILGPQLITDMHVQAERFGAVFVEQNVTAVTGDKNAGFTVHTDGGAVYSAKSLLIASGASAKWLGLESEKRLMGKGVSACATCDGFFFRNQVVAVVGGGDSAMEEATFLTKFASKVYILVRGSKSDIRASRYMINKAETNPKIEFLYSTQVKEVLGDTKVTGLVVFDSISGAERTLSDVQGLFVAIGHKPNTDFLIGFLDLDELGYIKVRDNTVTSREGVFASGDVSDRRYRQAITAAGLGCMASLDVERFLSGHEHA